MPATVDEIKTLMSVAGASSYMAAMLQAARATEDLARRTRRANQQMAANTNATFDEIANRWRDAKTGQFVKGAGSGWGGPAALATGIATAYALEIAFLTKTLQLLKVAWVDVTREGMKFESLMKDTEIQSGSTAEAMERVKSAALSQDLVDLGMSGTMAADAYKLLASEGYSAAEMQQAMLPIMQTAVATGGDQAQMTRMMLAIMRQYKFELSDLPAIGNAITGALNMTTFQIDDLMGAMKYAGPIASSMGWSFGETVAVLNVLYQQMGNFEMVGTGFRGVMNALMTPSQQMQAAFAEAGLNIQDFAKYSNDAGAALQWLQSGTWNQALIMRAFGAEAGLAATILIGAAVPSIIKTGDTIDTTGNVARDATNKMSTLEGRIAQLTAGFANLKIELYEASKFLSSDLVQGVSLAQQAVSQYLDASIEKLQAHEKATGTNRDMQLEVAQDIIKAGAAIATIMIHISRVLAYQAAQVLVLVESYQALKLVMLDMELNYRKMWPGISNRESELPALIKRTRQDISETHAALVAAGKWAIGGEATKVIEQIERAKEDLLQRVAILSALRGVKMPSPSSGASDTSRNKAATATQQPVTEDLEEANKLYAQQIQAIAEITRQQKSLTDDPVRAAQIELAGKEAALEILRRQEATALRLKADEEKLREARLARMRGESEVLEAQKAIRDQESRVNEHERSRNVQYFEELAKRHRAVNDAVQMVIGGRLSEQVQEQIKRLGSLGEAKGWLRGIRRQGNNRIVLELQDRTGTLTQGQINQVGDWILGNLRQSAARAPI